MAGIDIMSITLMSGYDRLFLAITLASSVLQLDGTSWVRQQWRSGDVFFLPSEEDGPRMSRMDLLHPYVSWHNMPSRQDQGSAARPDQSIGASQIQNDFLFALGCTLIELSLKQRLIDRRIPADRQESEAMTDFTTAMRLRNEVYEESGLEYGDVVHRCLTCSFNLRNLRNFTFDNEEFQKAVIDHVYTSLERDFEHFNGSQKIT